MQCYKIDDVISDKNRSIASLNRQIHHFWLIELSRHTANAEVDDVALDALMRKLNLSRACVESRECARNTQNCAANRKKTGIR